MLKNRNLRLQFSWVLIVFILILPLQSTVTNAATGDGSSSAPYSVSQAISNQNNSVKTVQGYIVGQPTATTTVLKSNFPNDYALALADSANETNTAKMIYVQIPTSFRTSYGLKSNPSLMGKSIKITGSLSAYFSHPGLKDGTAFTMVGGNPVTPEPNPSTDGYYDAAIGKTGLCFKNSFA